jgi:hypothetical protein
MARSWVGRTIFACWPCMAMLRLREARHSYMNCENTEECYECAVVSRKMVDQIRSSPTLRHKAFRMSVCTTFIDCHYYSTIIIIDCCSYPWR